MVFLPTNESFIHSSGIINVGFLEDIFHSIIDEAFLDLARPVTLHLRPSLEEDVTTQSQGQAQQINPFFGGRVSTPKTNTRVTGTKVTSRDVIYSAMIKVGPLRAGKDNQSIGDLKANEAMLTLAIEALPHIQETFSITVEGRRYSILETRPTGFSIRRHLMVKLQEINETETPVPDSTVG